ncbi:hypothetical protein [Micromonospora sp. NPDC002575]|uniref:hypothetical protein n=1 Tax=Micromonospora sp. NPDC002575 TaxID=3364222 RepID=UPI00369FEF4B
MDDLDVRLGQWERGGSVFRQNVVRWRSWLPLCISLMVAAAGVGLTWESNPLGGERSGLAVMFGHRASVLLALVFLGSLLVAFGGAMAAVVHGRKTYPVAVLVCAMAAMGSISWYGIQVAGERVRAIGMDSAGNLIEPEAASRLGVGWYLTATALLIALVLAADLARRARAAG